MCKVLVVGASGQLGSAILKHLDNISMQSIALIRSTSNFNYNLFPKTEVCVGDLANTNEIDLACSKATLVIATASAIVPKKGDKFGDNEIILYQNLINSCQKNKIERLIFISAFTSPFEHLIPEFRVKRQIENLIIKSGIPYTIFRCAAFMDIYFAVMGSNLVMKNVTNPTLKRDFWFTRFYNKLTSGILEKYGIAIVPSNGKTKQSFICVNDVAAFMVKALFLPNTKNRTIELAGKNAISWEEVVNIYGELLHKKIRKIHVPLFVLKLTLVLMKPFSPASENSLQILSLLGRHGNLIDMNLTKEEFGLQIKDSRQYLKDLLI